MKTGPTSAVSIPRPGAWTERGHCVNSFDPDLWHAGDSGGRPDSDDETIHSDDVQLALDICRGCPVRNNCLAYALEVPPAQDWGVWGATTPRQRANIRRRARRGTS